VLAAYYYDLDLLSFSAERHDATAPDGRLVQIKAAQGIHNIAMRSEPEHLIVLWLDDNTSEACEVCNGPGSRVGCLREAGIKWNAAYNYVEAQKNSGPSYPRSEA